MRKIKLLRTYFMQFLSIKRALERIYNIIYYLLKNLKKKTQKTEA